MAGVAAPDPVDLRLLSFIADTGRAAVHEIAAQLGMDVREVASRLAALSTTGLPLLVGVECDPHGIRNALASVGGGGNHPGSGYPTPYPQAGHQQTGSPPMPPQQHVPYSGGPHNSGPYPSGPYPSGPYHTANPHGAGHAVQGAPSGPHPAQSGPSPAPSPQGQQPGAQQMSQPFPAQGAWPGSAPQAAPAPAPGAPPPNQPTTWGPPASASWARGDQPATAPPEPRPASIRTGKVGTKLDVDDPEGARISIQLVEVVDPADFLHTAAGYALENGERSVVVHTELTNHGPTSFTALPDLHLVLVTGDGSTVAKAPVQLSSRPPHRMGVPPGETAGGHTVFVLPEHTDLTAVRWSPRPGDEQRTLTWDITDL